MASPKPSPSVRTPPPSRNSPPPSGNTPPPSTVSPPPSTASPPPSSSASVPPPPASASVPPPPSSASVPPPPSSASVPPPSTAPPPSPSTVSPPPQTNDNPPPSVTPSTPSPPPESPATGTSPPRASPPTTSTAPPIRLTPPPAGVPPPSGTPSLGSSAPVNSPPQASSPPETSPSPPSRPAENPPPPPSRPSENLPPQPPPNPSQSLPPPRPVPPQISPPPPSSPPESGPSPPLTVPPPRSSRSPPVPTPPTDFPPQSGSGPPANAPHSRISPPSSIVQLVPPPPTLDSPPSQNPLSPSASPTLNDSIPVDASNPSHNGGIGTGHIVAISVVAGILVITLIGLALCILWNRRKKKAVRSGGYIMPSSIFSSTQSDSSNEKTQSSAAIIGSHSGSSDFAYSSPEPGGLGNSRSFFTYEELNKATNGFSAQNLLGKGGFGSVYKGHLADGRVVAVKQLKVGGGQGEREFRAEVETIKHIHHRHLVSLVGYCIAENRRLLVYEYVPNNTLYFHLHEEGKPVLDWATRLKVAAGAARGIAYLHEDCHPRIIHRDIKSSNILLDSNFEARVADFGLARLFLDANTHVTTRVMGTFGYMAPEYASSGKLTEKSDVFSFGVVLLELITGRKPVDPLQPLGDESLVEWARPLLSHALETEEFDSLVDPKLGKNYVESEMFRMIEVAAACVRHLGAKRPRMGQIVRAFDSLANPDLNNGMTPGQSEQFNTAQLSAEIRLFRRMAFGSQDYSTDFFNQSNWSN